MDLLGNPLLRNWLNFGQFEPFNPQLSARFSSKRNSLNRSIRFIVFFNVVKLAIILLAAWLGFPDLKLILIELYLLDENQQKFIDIGILIMQFGIYLGYSYWAGLDEKASALDSFRFLLTPDNPKDRSRYQQRYHLDQQSTDKFLAVYRLASTFLRLVITVYLSFIAVVIIRCLYHSFYTVCLAYFLTFGLLLSVGTFIACLFLVIFAFSRFALLLLSAEFLIYRLNAINARIFNRFIKAEPVTVGGLTEIVKKLRKQRASLLRVLYILNDFCRQFRAINSVLDKSISMLMVGSFICLFILPYFLMFVENEQSVRLVLIFLVMGIYVFSFSFSICNDRLRRQVGAFGESKSHLQIGDSSQTSTNFVSSWFHLRRSKRSRTPYTTFNHFSIRQRPKFRSRTSYR